MNETVSSRSSGGVVQAFNADTLLIPINAILPVRTISKTARASVKYRQIACSIAEIGLVEPPVVFQDKQRANSYLLMDGHIRIGVLKELGHSEVECLLSNDDEAFTYNKRISRLSGVQEQRMIAKALERNVPKEKLAKALDIHVRSLNRKAALIDGICQEAVNLLRDKICPMTIFDILRKMIPIRQVEAAELLVNANNYTVSYATAILVGTPQAQLVNPTSPKRIRGMTAEALARTESELSRLQQTITSIQDNYGRDHLHLTVVKGYLAKLIGNQKITKYLEKRQPEFLTEFRNIVQMSSTIPAD